VRRTSTEEGCRLPLRVLGTLFRQFVGLELMRAKFSATPSAPLRKHSAFGAAFARINPL
jgi:hypothetical protein